MKNEIIFDENMKCDVHPNTFDIFAYKNEELLDKWRVYSVGGGTFKVEGKESITVPNIYKEKNWLEVMSYCKEKNIDLYDYVCEVEGNSIKDFLYEIWNTMQYTIKEGLSKTGLVPGRLKLQRRAKRYI